VYYTNTLIDASDSEKESRLKRPKIPITLNEPQATQTILILLNLSIKNKDYLCTRHTIAVMAYIKITKKYWNVFN
jgi:hypothetical protein